MILENPTLFSNRRPPLTSLVEDFRTTNTEAWGKDERDSKQKK
jgi:hypothetical protein